MRDNLGPRDLQSVSLKPGWREYQAMYGCATVDAEPIFCTRKVVDHSLPGTSAGMINERKSLQPIYLKPYSFFECGIFFIIPVLFYVICRYSHIKINWHRHILYLVQVLS
jgi:hypothetical protein